MLKLLLLPIKSIGKPITNKPIPNRPKIRKKIITGFMKESITSIVERSHRRIQISIVISSGR